MTSRVAVSICAYNARASLVQLVDNVSHYVDPEMLVVFDASPHQRLTEGLDVDRCPTSAPLRWGHLVPYFEGVMEWLTQRHVSCDYLMTLHSDMLFIRHGIADHLDAMMVESSYAGHGYLRTDAWCESRIPCLRRFHTGWERIWGPLFGIEAPSWAYSPGQVFRHDFLQRAARFPTIERIIELGRRSRLLGIEELLYATLADAMGCNPVRFPEESGCHQPPVDLPLLKTYVGLPTVHMIHKVDMDPDHPVRHAVRRLQDGRRGDLDHIPSSEHTPWPLDPPARSSGAIARLKDVYFRFLP